jgi:UDP-N-acetylglucosamine 2-epimerase
VVTLHRPSNIDDKDTLRGIMEALIRISEDMPVIFPAHPRTKKTIESFGMMDQINGSGIEMLPPLPYMSFLKLWKDASLVLTDSGGMQEETTALGVPCFTVRENTERPVTIDEGTNILVGTTKQGILSEYEAFRNGASKKGRVPELWDRKAAVRIVKTILDF